MKIREVNRSVINLLRYLSDDGKVEITQHTHIKVTGILQGKKTVLTLCSSPSSPRYFPSIKSKIRRILESLNVDKEQINFIRKNFIHI